MLIPDFLDGLKARLETIDGLTVTTDPGATIVVDMVTVAEGEIEYHSTSTVRGYSTIAFTATLYVSRADSAEGVRQARYYKSAHGEKSLVAAIETSLGTSDALGDMPSIMCESARTDVATVGEGASFVTVVVEGTAQIKGSDS